MEETQKYELIRLDNNMICNISLTKSHPIDHVVLYTNT